MVTHTDDRTGRGKWCALFGGTIIDAQTHDADKLIRCGKAVRVDVTGNNIVNHDDDFTDNDISVADINDAATAVDDDASAPTASDDAPESNEPQEASNTDAEVDAEAEENDGETQMATTADEDQRHQVHDAETTGSSLSLDPMRRWTDSMPHRTIPS